MTEYRCDISASPEGSQGMRHYIKRQCVVTAGDRQSAQDAAIRWLYNTYNINKSAADRLEHVRVDRIERIAD